MDIEAADLLPRIAGANVLCIGDIMLDKYIHGSASRISPEAPVPVVHVKECRHIPGGVGNVAKNLAAWNARPMLASVVGDDANAGKIAELLPLGGENGEEEESGGAPGASALSLVCDPSRPTTVKTRVVAGIQQIVRYDEEKKTPLSPEIVDALLAEIAILLPRAKAVALSDYDKGVVNPRVCEKVIALAQKHNIPVVVDPKGNDYGKYKGAYLVKPNCKELGVAVNRTIDNDDQIIAAARELMRRHGIRNILVTLSERGMLLLCGEKAKPVALPSKARAVFDVTGAGDTVLAAVTAALAAGASLELGARLARLAAGVVVGKVGTATAAPAEIREAAGER